MSPQQEDPYIMSNYFLFLAHDVLIFYEGEKTKSNTPQSWGALSSQFFSTLFSFVILSTSNYFAAPV